LSTCPLRSVRGQPNGHPDGFDSPDLKNVTPGTKVARALQRHGCVRPRQAPASVGAFDSCIREYQMFAYYLQLGLRSLRRNPTLTALMVIAIGAGVATSMTS